jgi:hypothetical protein
MTGWVWVELGELVTNIKKKMSLIDPFLSFLHKYELKNIHNICFMQDPCYKILHIVCLFTSHQKGIFNVQEYDQKSLCPMLVKCYE